MEILDLEQGSDEWLAARKQSITSTDAGVLMGVSPYKTPYRLWQEKLNLVKPDELNYAMRYGSRMEPVVREMVEAKFYDRFDPAVMKKGIFMASLDGVSTEFDGGLIIEIKCGPTERHAAIKCHQGEYLTKELITENYYAQVQHSLYVSGADSCIFCHYNNDDLATGMICRDDEYIQKIVNVGEEFHRKLQDFEPPKADPTRDITSLDPGMEGLEKELALIEDKIAALNTRKERIRKKLIDEAGGCAQGKWWKITPVTSERTDYAKACRDAELDLSGYKKPSSVSWRFSRVKVDG